MNFSLDLHAFICIREFAAEDKNRTGDLKCNTYPAIIKLKLVRRHNFWLTVIRFIGGVERQPLFASEGYGYSAQGGGEEYGQL